MEMAGLEVCRTECWEGGLVVETEVAVTDMEVLATVTVGAVEASAGGIVRVRVGAGRARDREAPGLLSPRNRGVSGPPRNDERHGECD